MGVCVGGFPPDVLDFPGCSLSSVVLKLSFRPGRDSRSLRPADWQSPEQCNPSGIWQFHFRPCSLQHLDRK